MASDSFGKDDYAEFRTWDDTSRRPTGELVKDLLAEGQHLIRGELELARAELRHEAKKAARGAGALGAAAMVGHTAFLAASAGLVLLLGTFMAYWLAAVIVALVYAAGAAILAQAGMEKVKEVNAPERTIRSLKEDRRWARDTIRSAKSESRANA